MIATVHKFLQFGSAPNAANEVDAFAGARIIYPEQRCEHMLLQKRDIQSLDRIAVVGEL